MTDDTVPTRRSRVVSAENLPGEMPEVIERIALKAPTCRASESWDDGPIPVKHELKKLGRDTPSRTT